MHCISSPPSLASPQSLSGTSTCTAQPATSNTGPYQGSGGLATGDQQLLQPDTRQQSGSLGRAGGLQTQADAMQGGEGATGSVDAGSVDEGDGAEAVAQRVGRALWVAVLCGVACVVPVAVLASTAVKRSRSLDSAAKQQVRYVLTRGENLNTMC